MAENIEKLVDEYGMVGSCAAKEAWSRTLEFFKKYLQS